MSARPHIKTQTAESLFIAFLFRIFRYLFIDWTSLSQPLLDFQREVLRPKTAKSFSVLEQLSTGGNALQKVWISQGPSVLVSSALSSSSSLILFITIIPWHDFIMDANLSPIPAGSCPCPHYKHSRPTVDRHTVGRHPAGSIDRVSTDIRSTYRPTLNSRPTLGRITDTRPTLDRYLTDTWPIVRRYLTDTWPTLDRYLTDLKSRAIESIAFQWTPLGLIDVFQSHGIWTAWHLLMRR